MPYREARLIQRGSINATRHALRATWTHAILAATAVLQVERDSPRVAQLVSDAQLLANSLMQNDHVWAWVQRVSTALIRRRRLNGRDVQRCAAIMAVANAHTTTEKIVQRACELADHAIRARQERDAR